MVNRADYSKITLRAQIQRPVNSSIANYGFLKIEVIQINGLVLYFVML